MTMKTNARTKWILLAAIAAVPVAGLTTPAVAQYQNEQRGNALDANRRIGDDRNYDNHRSFRVDNRIQSIQQPTGNQIITGNVTGNRQFRGPAGYVSEREFRGGTASDASDNFIRSSAGTAGASRRVTDYNVSVPFYPGGRTVQPPPGFTSLPALGGGYVPSAAVDNRVDRGSITPRGGSTILTPQQPMGTLGSEQNQVISASPLLGVQQVPYSTQPGLYGMGIYGPRVGTLDEATVERMRNELRTGGSPESGEGNPAGQLNGVQAPGTGDTGLGTFDAQGQPIGQQTVGSQNQNNLPGTNGRQGDQQQGQPAGSVGGRNLSGNTVDANNLTGQSTRQRLLPTPGEQTPAYAELRRKLAEFANDPNMTDEEAFRAARRARQQAEAAAKETKPTDVTTPTVPGQDPQQQQQQQPQQQHKPQDPNAPQQTDAERLGLQDFSRRNEELLKGGPIDRKVPSGNEVAIAPTTPRITAPVQPTQPPQAAAPRTGPKPAPVKIDSLAKGVPGKGLADLLTGAESLMKEGRFSSALEKYDAAEQVAPNNPLIKLGRANAELGASYFARAEQHLREAFAADEALLMGQYDLRAFFGEDRLKVIANDLKEIANKEQTQVTPVFLLAYVAYNSENEPMAAGYLDLAEKRSGGKDALIKKIREHWTLPAAEEVEAAPASAEPATPAPAVEQNK